MLRLGLIVGSPGGGGLGARVGRGCPIAPFPLRHWEGTGMPSQKHDIPLRRLQQHHEAGGG